ncbi:hypothetical protein Aperf_G00000094289 [Anoplocephala perfoliata]
MEDIEHLPKELRIKPRCLIALTGLNVETNPFHAHVWKSFSRGQPDNHDALRFINLPLDYPYSKSKPKHSSHYEWYQVKGIIKRHWMKKHLEELPAVVIVFFDLESDDPSWSEKAKEYALRVDRIRSNLISRGTKFVVTLLQTRSTGEIGSDVNATTRIQELSELCHMSIKNIYILQQSEFMLSLIKSLETEIFAMAYNYYHNAAKLVKAHKSNLTKTNQQLLLVRHDFKIAFFDELKQESTLALKQYRQAYNNLVELKVSDAHLLELKVVAGFINFKICQIAFQIHAWDAITQFRRHIDNFKDAIGMPEVAYEHEAWLSKQYEIFGNLFEEATQFNVQATIARHPGFYFHEAGHHAISRRTLAAKLCSSNNVTNRSATSFPPTSLNQPPNPGAAVSGFAVRVGIESLSQTPLISNSPPDGDEKLPEFFGQRAWRNAGQTVETTDPAKEREGILGLQAKEALVDHSELIIPLFARASLYFERYESKRMRNYPTFCIAEEFFRKNEYESALKMGISLHLYLSSNFPMCNAAGTICTDAINRYGTSLRLYPFNVIIVNCTLLYNAQDGRRIEGINNLPTSADLSTNSTLRTESISAEVIDLTNIKSCVEVKAQFTKASFTIDEPVKLMVFFKCFTTFPLRFNGLSVRLNHEALQGGPIAHSGTHSEDSPNGTDPAATSSASACKWNQSFDLTPDEHLRVIIFTLDPLTLGSAVQVEAIEVGLVHANRIFYLRWFPSAAISSSERPFMPFVSCDYSTRLEDVKTQLASASLSSSSSLGDEENVIFNSTLTPFWEFFNNQLSAEVLPKASNLEMSLRHTPPVLCNEKYVILCQILNTEATNLTDLTISAMLAGGGANDAPLELNVSALEAPKRMGSVAVGQAAGYRLNPASSNGDELFSQVSITPHLSQGVDLVCPIFFHCPTVAGDRSLRVDARYSVLAQLPSPTVKVISWPTSGSIRLLTSETNGDVSSGLTLTRCVQSKRIQLSVTPPLEFTSRLLSLQHEPIDTVVTGKPFVLDVVLTNSSPWPIDVEGSLFNLGSGVRFKGSTYDPLPEIVSLDRYESLSEAQVLVVPDGPIGAEPVNLGQYVASWRRRRPQSRQDPSFPKSSITTSTFNLLTCDLVTLPYTIELNIPPFGLLHAPFTISYTLGNKTSLPQELTMQLEPAESFVFCGVKLASFRLLPNSSRKLDFTLLPLRPGYLPLPRFTLWTGSKVETNAGESIPTADGGPMVEIKPHHHLLKQLQSHIFIMPNREGVSMKM